MATFTSTLSDDLFEQLAEKTKALSVPKNTLIEAALKLYLEPLEKDEYMMSFKLAFEDKDTLLIAEEGIGSSCKNNRIPSEVFKKIPQSL